ncbi:hypothetical protein [Candidatus Planktophila versatilis]|uniref:SbsA Ig-like domain-containing protein n=1 Tax=Candidatus Planktophila versatilis TaxID=1884905 RepID=A0ABM6MCU4_9ACTN|nr:hypothetical protein [Candidatus Planktophila versatilis]ASY16708.1 hypothetical protein A1sIA79_00230 [Candidatus Planktophila versatilis]
MSTTTTFKRIAFVTVAALGLGLLSVAPSNAAVAADTLTVTDGTASVGDTVTATSATATISFLPSAYTTDSHSVTASLVSGPAANTLFPVLKLTETTSAIVSGTVANLTPETATAIGGDFDAYNKVYVKGRAAAVTTAKFAVFIGTSSNTGVVTAGTYVVRITPAAAPTAGTAAAKDITIVVTAATQSSSSSTAHISTGTAAPDAATDIVAVVAANTAKTAATDAAANIKVTQVKSSGAAANESITAVITGPGTIGGAGTQAAAASMGRSITVGTNGSGVAFINVFGDGTSGKATITLTGVTSGYSFGSKTVLFSSTTIATLTAAAVNPVVAASGTAKTDAVSVIAKDADGNQIYNPTVYTLSSATSVISNSYSTTGCNWDGTDLVTYCDVTPVAAGSANITFTNRASATATTPTTAVTSNAVAIRVGSTTAATMKLTTDKASYLPGEKITLTLAILDSAGNAVAGSADNTTYANVFATGGITSDYAFYTGSDTLTAVFAQLSPKTSLKTWTLFAPLQAAEVTMTAIPGASFPAAYQATNALGLTAKITVGNSAGVDAATDAANEATDAANAATDAALAAADAADAATAAAEDASAAVATLAKSVNTALASLKKQITALTALVNKLLKK